MATHRVGWWAVCAWMLFPSAALAQEPKPNPEPAAQPNDVSAPTSTPAPAPPATPAPDVVRLKNGSMFRGTIAERVEGEYVEILLVNGKTRRFTMDEVSYAGATTDLPTAPRPPTTQAPPRAAEGTRPLVTIHGLEASAAFSAREPGVAFHRRTGTAQAGSVEATGYDEICVAPCNATLPAGTYTFGLSKERDAVLVADSVTLPAGPSRVEGVIESRSGLRIGLLVGGIAAAGVGIYIYSTAKEEKCDQFGCRDELNQSKFVGGLLLAGAGVGVGLWSFAIKDKAVVTVRPLPAAALRQTQSSSQSVLPAGISAVGAF